MARPFDCRNDIEAVRLLRQRQDTPAHSTGGSNNRKVAFHLPVLQVLNGLQAWQLSIYNCQFMAGFYFLVLR
jgi:hypothetical protein